MRWMTLLGRIGTVILMIGLALLVFSHIPLGTGFQPQPQPIEPEKYIITELGVYTPQTGLQILVNSSGNVNVYLLGLSSVELDNWTTQIGEAYPSLFPGSGYMLPASFAVPLIFAREAYPGLNDTQIEDIMAIRWDVAVLDNGLQTHPEIILWDPPPSSTFSYEFSPADTLDIMAVVANPSSNTVEVSMETRDLATVAAKERVILATRLLIPIGIALAIPWLILKKVKKEHLEAEK
jgi:hypothetical protein